MEDNKIQELERLIENHKDSANCTKASNYPAEWLSEIIAKKKAVFAEYSDKSTRVKYVDEIHKEYSDKFDAKVGEVKIPWDGELITLGEAEQLLVVPELEVKENTLVKDRQLIKYYRDYLASTDWYIIRKMEDSIDIPEDVVSKRAEAKSILNDIK